MPDGWMLTVAMARSWTNLRAFDTLEIFIYMFVCCFSLPFGVIILHVVSRVCPCFSAECFDILSIHNFVCTASIFTLNIYFALMFSKTMEWRACDFTLVLYRCGCLCRAYGFSFVLRFSGLLSISLPLFFPFGFSSIVRCERVRALPKTKFFASLPFNA